MIELDGENWGTFLAFDAVRAGLLEWDLVVVERFEEFWHDVPGVFIGGAIDIEWTLVKWKMQLLVVLVSVLHELAIFASILNSPVAFAASASWSLIAKAAWHISTLPLILLGCTGRHSVCRSVDLLLAACWDLWRIYLGCLVLIVLVTWHLLLHGAWLWELMVLPSLTVGGCCVLLLYASVLLSLRIVAHHWCLGSLDLILSTENRIKHWILLGWYLRRFMRSLVALIILLSLFSICMLSLWLLSASSRSLFLFEGLIGALPISAPFRTHFVLVLSSGIANVLLQLLYCWIWLLAMLAHLDLLSLIEASILFIYCSLQLVLDSSHNEFIGDRLVWNFFGANSCAVLLLRILLVGSCTLLVAIVGYSTFEIEDIILDCGERVVVANIKTSCCPLFLFLTVHVDLNLGSLDWCRIYWSLLYIFSGCTSITRVASCAYHLDTAVELFSTRHYLYGLVKHRWNVVRMSGTIHIMLVTAWAIIAGCMGWACNISCCLLLLFNLLLGCCPSLVLTHIDFRTLWVGIWGKRWILNHDLGILCVIVTIRDWVRLRPGLLLLVRGCLTSKIELLSFQRLSHTQAFLYILCCTINSSCSICVLI